LAGAAALISVLTVASRLIGFVRTLVLGKVANPGLSTAYLTANIVPNIIFEIVAGGALASLVVPLVAGDVARGRRDGVGRTASALVCWVLVILVPLAVLLAVFADPVVSLLLGAGAAGPERAGEVAVGTRMLRIFAPQIPLYGIGIVLTGLLQAHRRFAWPVLAPLLSSVVVITTYVTYGAVEPDVPDVGQVSTAGQLILAVGTTLGVVVLSLCLLIPVRALRLRWAPRLRFDGDARRTVRQLAGVGIVTVAAQQLTLALSALLVNRGTGPGAILTLTLAQTVYLLPWSVLAVPVAISVFQAMATSYATGDDAAYRRTLAGATRSVLLLSAFGAAALVAAAGPIGRLFAATATAARPDPSALRTAVIAFAPGLLGYGLYALHSRALYARGRNRSAALATVAGWGTVAAASVALSVLLPVADRVTALGAANSVGMAVLAVVLVVMVRRKVGPGAQRGVGRATASALVAGVAAAAAGASVGLLFPASPGVAADLVQGALSGLVALVVFGAVAAAVDREDLRRLVARLRRAAHPGDPAAPTGPADPNGLIDPAGPTNLAGGDAAPTTAPPRPAPRAAVAGSDAGGGHMPPRTAPRTGENGAADGRGNEGGGSQR
jgi:putative peptidoglycan lipid II flippase